MNIHDQGIEIVRNFLTDDLIDEIISEVSLVTLGDQEYGVRNVEKKFKTIQSLLDSELIQDKVKDCLTAQPSFVRAIFFDKTPDKNWLVSWHQDKTISVNDKVEVNGWGPWSIKEGVQHVQPSVDVLNRMITLRLHLDDADETNGCLKVIPESHLFGVLSQSELSELVQRNSHYSCDVKAGDLVLMRPLLIHGSSKSLVPSHRRVVHLEFCDFNLPDGLSWV